MHRGDYQREGAIIGFNRVLQYGQTALIFSDIFSDENIKYFKIYCLNRMGHYQEALDCIDEVLTLWVIDGSLRRTSLLYERGLAKISLNDLSSGCQDVRTSYYEEGLQRRLCF